MKVHRDLEKICLIALCVAGCSELVAPTNRVTIAGTSGNAAVQSNNSDDATPTTDTIDNGSQTDESASQDPTTDDSASKVETVDPAAEKKSAKEEPPIGSAKDVTGAFANLNLKYVYATITPAANPVPARLTLTASEAPAFLKSIKSYNCIKCTDDIDACFCAKADNAGNDRCKANLGNKRTFTINFSGPSPLLAQDQQDLVQVKADGFPKVTDYTLVALPNVNDDPTGFATASTANSNQGMTVSYFQTEGSKSRFTTVGTFKFAAAPTAVDQDWTGTLDIKFVPNATAGDTGAEEAIKATLSSKIYKAPTFAASTCKPLPEEYSEPVFE